MQVPGENYHFHFGESSRMKWEVEIFSPFGNASRRSFQDGENASLVAKQAMVHGASKVVVYQVSYWLDSDPGRF